MTLGALINRMSSLAFFKLPALLAIVAIVAIDWVGHKLRELSPGNGY